MQSNQELLVEAILSQYEVDPNILPNGILDSIYAIPTNLVNSDDIINYYNQIGHLIGKKEKSAELFEILDEEVHIIIHKLKFIAEIDRPKVIVLDELNPTVINTSAYIKECIKIAGGIATSSIADADKIIIINQEEGIVSQIPTILSDSTWMESNALKLNQVFLINKDTFGKIPGKNYCEELETFAEILQPKYFFYGLEGETWIQFQLT